MKSTLALIFSVIALIVAVSGVGSSSAFSPGTLERCVQNAAVVKEVGITINGRYMHVWTNAPANADIHKPGIDIIPMMQRSCFAN